MWSTLECVEAVKRSAQAQGICEGNSGVLYIQPELAQEGRDGFWAGMFPELHRLLLQEGHIQKRTKIGLLTFPPGHEGSSGWLYPILGFVVSWLLEALWFLLVF